MSNEAPLATRTSADAGHARDEEETRPSADDEVARLQRDLAETRRALAAERAVNDELKQELARSEREAQRQREALARLEDAVETNQETLSFRLGYLLIHAPKSWQGMRRLPSDLLNLHREAKRRRGRRRADFGHDGSEIGSSRSMTGSAREAMRSAEVLAERTLALFAQQGAEAAANFVETTTGASDRERAHALTQLAKVLRSSNAGIARTLAERAYALEPLPFRAKWLAFQQRDAGEIERPAALLERLPTDSASKPSEKARIAEILGLARLRRNLPSIPPPSAKAYSPRLGTSLYVASSALPYHVSGYTVRTQELLRAIGSSGWQTLPVMRPGYPADRGIQVTGAATGHDVDGIWYQHIAGPHLRRVGLDDYIEEAARALVDAAKRARPALIHAASNHVNALPALIAARRLGIPFVYEVRGMWELTAASRNVEWENTERFHLERDLETLVARHADHVWTLTQGLADDLAARGVERERLALLPNSVDPSNFAPRGKDLELAERLGLDPTAFTVVYAGSLVHYEGLDDLVRAIALLNEDDVNAALVVAGDGEALEGLRALTQQLAVERQVHFLGRLPTREIPGIWSLADAAAFPRKPFRVCQLVSPLKPLEAMAMAVPVVVSDVAALREMVREGETGLVHEASDARSLASRLAQLARDASLRERLGRAAREAVLRDRTWRVAGERVVTTYRHLQEVNGLEPVALAAGRTSMSAEEKAEFEARLEQAYELGGATALRELAARQAAGRGRRLLAFCLLKAANCCQRLGDARAVELARSALETDETAATLRGVARIVYASGDFEGATTLVDRLERAVGKLSGKDDELAREVRGRTQLLALMTSRAATALPLPLVTGRSVYFLHFSLPYSSVGYATRSHGLIVGMKAAGCDVRAYTRCGFPLDFQPGLEASEVAESEVVDGVEYRRLLDGKRRGSTESEYMLRCAEAYERVLREERPEVVHAASNYATALPALIAARRLGLPFIYEIRGFWEITRSSRDNDFENSTRYALMRQFENLVAKEADHVFTLTSAMKEELVSRGVAEGKITLVHNGVDPDRFVPLSRNETLSERLGLPASVPVVGYAGSFVDYEGLDDLIGACALLARRGLEFRVLLVGDGAEMPRLRGLVAQEQLEGVVLLTGRVPHDEVEAYYSLMDICPFPRKPWEVCEMVSPLKPFEAMAMAKAVVVSSTHALREIVQDGNNGLVFEKGSVESLAATLERLLTDPSLRHQLAESGRSWALQHRTWREGGRVVVEGYRSLLAARGLDTTRIPA